MFWKQKGRKSLVMGLIALLLIISQSQPDSPPVGIPSGTSAQIRTDRGIESCLDRWKFCMIEASAAREEAEANIQVKKIRINVHKVEGIEAEQSEQAVLRTLKTRLVELKSAETQSVARCQKELDLCVQNHKIQLKARADLTGNQKKTDRQQRIRTTQENMIELEERSRTNAEERKRRKNELRDSIIALEHQQKSLIAEIQRMRADQIQRQGKAQSQLLVQLNNQLASLRQCQSDSISKNERQLELLRTSDRQAKDDLAAKNQNLETQKRNFQRDLPGAGLSPTEENNLLNLQRQEFTKRLVANTKEKNEANQEIEWLRINNNQLQNQIQSLRQENQQIDLQIQQLSRDQSAKVSELKFEINALEADIHSKKQRARQNANPEGQSPQQHSARQEFNQTLHRHKANQKQRREELRRLQDELLSQKRKLDDLLRSKALKQAEKSKLPALLQGEKSKLKHIRTQLEKCQAELTQLRQQSEQTRATIPRPQMGHFRKKNYLKNSKQEQQEILLRTWATFNWDQHKFNYRSLRDYCNQFKTDVLDQILLRGVPPSQNQLQILKNIYQEHCKHFFSEAWESKLQRMRGIRTLDYIDNKMRKTVFDANRLLSNKPRSVQDCIVLESTLLSIKRNGGSEIDNLFPAILQIYNQYCKELLKLPEIKPLMRDIQGQIKPYAKEGETEQEKVAIQKLIRLKLSHGQRPPTNQECSAYRNDILAWKVSNRSSKLLLLLDFHENQYQLKCKKTLPYSDHPNEMTLPGQSRIGSIVYFSNEFYKVVKLHTGLPVTIPNVDLIKVNISIEDEKALTRHAQLGETMFEQMRRLPLLNLVECKKAFNYLTSQQYIQFKCNYQLTQQHQQFEELIQRRCKQILQRDGLTSTAMISEVLQTQKDEVISQTFKLQRLVNQKTFILGLPRPLPRNICEAFAKIIQKMKRIVSVYNLRYLSHRRVKYYVTKGGQQFADLCPRMKDWIKPYEPQNTESRQSVKEAIKRDLEATYTTFNEKEILTYDQCRTLFKAIDKKTIRDYQLEEKLEKLEDLYWIACEQILHAKRLTYRRRTSDFRTYPRRRDDGVYFQSYDHNFVNYQRFVDSGLVGRFVSQWLQNLIEINRSKLTFHQKMPEDSFSPSEEKTNKEIFTENLQIIEAAIVKLTGTSKVYPTQQQCVFIAHFLAELLEGKFAPKDYITRQVLDRQNTYKTFFAQACISKYPQQANNHSWGFLLEDDEEEEH